MGPIPQHDSEHQNSRRNPNPAANAWRASKLFFLNLRFCLKSRPGDRLKSEPFLRAITSQWKTSIGTTREATVKRLRAGTDGDRMGARGAGRLHSRALRPSVP